MRHILAAIIGLLSLCIMPSVFSQDEPFLFDSERYGRSGNSNELRYCIDERDAAHAIDQAIWTDLAQRLLLENIPVEIKTSSTNPNIDDLYRNLLSDCVVFLGFKEVRDALPEWLITTQAYRTSKYTFYAYDSSELLISGLALPPKTRIGVSLGSVADLKFLQFNNSKSSSERYVRYPYRNDEAVISALRRGEVDVVLLWQDNAEVENLTFPEHRLTALPNPPLHYDSIGVVGVMLRESSDWRSALDTAIADRNRELQ